MEGGGRAHSLERGGSVGSGDVQSDTWSSDSVYFDTEYWHLLFYNSEADDCEAGGSAAADNTTTEAREQRASGDVAADPRGANSLNQ